MDGHRHLHLATSWSRGRERRVQRLCPQRGVRDASGGDHDVGLPTSLSYMDSAESRHVGDLNVAERWRMHDASRTPATLIGRRPRSLYP